jgi:RNA polymerase sigma-70 factor (ECF subfamily)
MTSYDKESFVRELLPHLDSLYNFARWLTHDSDETDDIVHDALSRVLLSWDGYSPGTGIRTYLFTVIRRTYINRLRRSRYEVTSFGYPEDDDILPGESDAKEFADLPAELIRKDLNEALADLPVEQRSVVLLADIEGFSLEEISKIMHIPVGTVKSKLWRTRQVLRKRLMSYQEQP